MIRFSRRLLHLLIPTLLSAPLWGQLVENGPWTGAIGPHSAEVRLIINEDRFTSLEVSTAKDFARYQTYSQSSRHKTDPMGLARYKLQHLEPDTTYYCRVRLGRQREYRSIGSFRTLPPTGQISSFRFAFASNHTTGSEAGAFSEISYQKPLFFLHLGNALNEDTLPTDSADWLALYERSFESFTQAELYREVPLVYTWNTRDYAGEGTYWAYRTVYPHYPLPADDREEEATLPNPINHAFSVGRVRFVVLDTQTARTAPDAENPTLLGEWQWAWLQEELKTSADTHPLIFLVSSEPWHVRRGVTGTGDHWGYYPEERERIESWLAAEGIGNVVVISGNAGFLAARLGTGEAGDLHELQAGVIDQHTAPALGSWTDGPLLPKPAEEFFGVVEVEDLRRRIEVTFHGMNQHGHDRFKSAFTITVP
jgi:hypothetical protein